MLNPSCRPLRHHGGRERVQSPPWPRHVSDFGWSTPRNQSATAFLALTSILIAQAMTVDRALRIPATRPVVTMMPIGDHSVNRFNSADPISTAWRSLPSCIEQPPSAEGQIDLISRQSSTSGGGIHHQRGRDLRTRRVEHRPDGGSRTAQS